MYKTYVLDKKETSLHSFIQYWESVYDNLNSYMSYREDGNYWNNIGIKDHKLISLIKENIDYLFFWKYGRRKLFQSQINILENVKRKIDELNKFRKISTPTMDNFKVFYQNVALECVKTKAPVISLFIVHIAHPFKFPIIDQHVIRAYKYMSSEDKSEVNPKEFINIYKYYIKFFNELLTKSKLPFRKIDKALWAFGKFLKNKGFTDLIF